MELLGDGQGGPFQAEQKPEGVVDLRDQVFEGALVVEPDAETEVPELGARVDEPGPVQDLPESAEERLFVERARVVLEPALDRGQAQLRDFFEEGLLGHHLLEEVEFGHDVGHVLVAVLRFVMEAQKAAPQVGAVSAQVLDERC